MTPPPRLWLLTAGCLIGACDGTSSPRLGDHAAWITNGAPDAMHEAVGALRLRRTACGEPSQLVCSGTLIAPRVFLTAAHCLSDLSSGIVALDQIEIVFGSAVSGVGHAVTDAVTHPAYDPDTGAHDLALLVLDATAPVAPAVRGSFERASIGDELGLVGYGATSPDSASGEKHVGVAVLSVIEAATVRLAPAPSLSCRRDSGGAVLRRIDDVEALVGVIRSGDAACASFTVATRIDAEEAAFLGPFVASVDPLPPAVDRPDPASDFCGVACATDAECPVGMRCLADGARGRRCGYAGLGPGLFGEACATGADCESGVCGAIGSGSDQACRCLTPCSTLDDAEGGGCSAQGRPGSGSLVVILVVLGIVRVRRSPGSRP